ncbi:MAG: YigZ family protein [Bifidobacteriaceae bacterium]|nr:YigZ family protein [Bifidobacteriaceae bacterium]
MSKSRFLALVAPCATAAEAAAVVAERRKQHYGARHHCTALVVGPQGAVQRSSDDGEPSGTAGVPMLEVLRRRRVTDVVAVVTRYFGGVLLGAGGLIRAYSGAVGAALDEAVLERLVERAVWEAEADFGRAGRLENAVRAWAAGRDAQVNVDYGAGGVTIQVELPPPQAPAFAAFAAAAGAAARPAGTVTVRRR